MNFIQSKLNMNTNESFESRKQVAIEDCKNMIDWYDRKKRTPRKLFNTFQVSAIVLSALTPIFDFNRGYS